MRHDLTNDETCTIPGTIQENSQETFALTDKIDDGIDTDHHREPDAEIRSEQLIPTDINPRSTKYDLRHDLKPNCNEDYRYYIATLSRLCYPEQLGTPYVDFGKVLRNVYGAPIYLPTNF